MSDRELRLRMVAVLGLFMAAGLAKVWHQGSAPVFFSGWGLGLALLTGLRLHLGRQR